MVQNNKDYEINMINYIFLCISFIFLSAFAAEAPKLSLTDLPDEIQKYVLFPILIKIAINGETKEPINTYKILCKKNKNIVDSGKVDIILNKFLVEKLSQELGMCYKPATARLVAKIVGPQFYTLWASTYPWEPREKYEDDIQKILRQKDSDGVTTRLLESKIDLYQETHPTAIESCTLIESMLDYEIRNDNLNGIALLKKNGADVNFNYFSYPSPLYMAIIIPPYNFDAGELLIKNKADINMPQKFSNDRTLLKYIKDQLQEIEIHAPEFCDRFKMIQDFLVEHGARE